MNRFMLGCSETSLYNSGDVIYSNPDVDENKEDDGTPDKIYDLCEWDYSLTSFMFSVSFTSQIGGGIYYGI